MNANLAACRASIAICLLGFSLNTQADLLQVSSPVFGAGSLAFDSSQNLYWLTPTTTVGMSYNEVSNLLATDSRYSGFRFATVAELANLYTAFSIPNTNDYGFGISGTTANVPGTVALQSLFGITYTFGSVLFETSGFVGSPFTYYVNPFHSFTAAYKGEVVLRVHTYPTPYAYVATTQTRLSVNTRYEGVGSWLVADTANISVVPEPSVLLLLISGIVGLAAFERSSGKARLILTGSC